MLLLSFVHFTNEYPDFQLILLQSCTENSTKLHILDLIGLYSRTKEFFRLKLLYRVPIFFWNLVRFTGKFRKSRCGCFVVQKADNSTHTSRFVAGEKQSAG